jgi:hypothetical protein
MVAVISPEEGNQVAGKMGNFYIKQTAAQANLSIAFSDWSCFKPVRL